MKRLTALATDPAYLDRYIAIRNRKQLKVRRPLIAAHDPYRDARMNLAGDWPVLTDEELDQPVPGLAD